MKVISLYSAEIRGENLRYLWEAISGLVPQLAVYLKR